MVSYGMKDLVVIFLNVGLKFLDHLFSLTSYTIMNEMKCLMFYTNGIR